MLCGKVMTTMKYKLLALDLDGTLLNSGKKISEGNINAIREYQKAGGRVIYSTGRSYTGARSYMDILNPTAPVITNNGGILVQHGDNPEILFEQGLEAEDARKIYELGMEYDVSMIVWCRFTLYGNRIDERLQDYACRFGHTTPLLSPGIDELLDIGITKILWYTDLEKCRRLDAMTPASLFNSVTVCNSEPQFLEFFNKKVSKSIVLGRVCQMYGLDYDSLCAVGDGENDICMLQAAGLGVAMANANDYTKSFADKVSIRNNDEDGVAEVIEMLLSE